MSIYRARCLGAAFLLAALVGCSGGSGNFVPVTGKVTLDGEPLPHAAITFIPKGATQALQATGMTGSDGTYSVMGPQGQKGVLPGEYKVVISRRVNPDGTPVPPNDPTPPIESKAREQLPAKYSDPARSELGAQVSKEAPTVNFSLALKKK